jgi:phenylacetate-CoA ligase
MIAHAVDYQHPDIEKLDRDGIVAIQRRKLATLGERLAESTEWVEYFARAGLHPRDLAEPDALTRVPTLEKRDLHERYPFPFLTTPMENVARFVATSGTTGLPVLFGFSYRDVRELMAAQMSRVLRCAGVRSGDRVYQGYGYGMWIGGVAMDWGLAAFGATNFGIGPGRAELVVEWLRDHAYTACTLSPLWLMTLVNAAKAKGIDPKRDWKLRVGLLGGQSVSAQFRAELEAEMPDGFVAQNIYGATESGGPNLGISCPYSHEPDLMHLINDDSILSEILDPNTLEPVAPGEIGEIVITTLDKEASPVVRWRTRDLVRVAGDPFGCGCGRRGLPLVGRIIGRSDDMLKVRGVIVFPSQIEDVIASHAHTVREAWQVYVDRSDRELDEATVAVERRATADLAHDAIARELAAMMHARLGIRFNVQVHDEGVLPRYEAKAVRVIVRA